MPQGDRIADAVALPLRLCCLGVRSLDVAQGQALGRFESLLLPTFERTVKLLEGRIAGADDFLTVFGDGEIQDEAA